MFKSTVRKFLCILQLGCQRFELYVDLDFDFDMCKTEAKVKEKKHQAFSLLVVEELLLGILSKRPSE